MLDGSHSELFIKSLMDSLCKCLHRKGLEAFRHLARAYAELTGDRLNQRSAVFGINAHTERPLEQGFSAAISRASYGSLLTAHSGACILYAMSLRSRSWLMMRR